VTVGARVIVVCGLRFEAKIAAGAGIHVVCAQTATLADPLDNAIADGCDGIVSFGTAGGLIDAFRPGDWIVARSIIDGAAQISCDIGWSETLLQALPHAHNTVVTGVAMPVASTQAKRALHAACGAAAVDMESQVVARLAQARNIPFVCCRVIIDSVERSLPDAALAGMRPDGSTDPIAVLASLLRHPGQLPSLLAVGRDAAIARRALVQGRKSIGNAFGRH
jgi:hopanoid-associated phosphorylase